MKREKTMQHCQDFVSNFFHVSCFLKLSKIRTKSFHLWQKTPSPFSQHHQRNARRERGNFAMTKIIFFVLSSSFFSLLRSPTCKSKKSYNAVKIFICHLFCKIIIFTQKRKDGDEWAKSNKYFLLNNETHQGVFISKGKPFTSLGKHFKFIMQKLNYSKTHCCWGGAGRK